jgi:hypothetical protein
MLELFNTQLQQGTEVADILFQQDGTPPHYHCRVTALLGATFPEQVDWSRWTYRVAATLTGPQTP